MQMVAFGSCSINTTTWTLTVDTQLRPDEREQDWNAAIDFAWAHGYSPIGDQPFSSTRGFDRYQLVSRDVALEIARATPEKEATL